MKFCSGTTVPRLQRAKDAIEMSNRLPLLNGLLKMNTTTSFSQTRRLNGNHMTDGDDFSRNLLRPNRLHVVTYPGYLRLVE